MDTQTCSGDGEVRMTMLITGNTTTYNCSKVNHNSQIIKLTSHVSEMSSPKSRIDFCCLKRTISLNEFHTILQFRTKNMLYLYILENVWKPVWKPKRRITLTFSVISEYGERDTAYHDLVLMWVAT